MVDELRAAVAELEQMRERVRTIRALHCELKSNGNPRYFALSGVVANLSKAIQDMQSEF